MAAAKHRLLETNGIKMHVAEMGSGSTVLLLHGFPETWYTWRYQLEALAKAGFHAVAPDLRGHGETECPKTASGDWKLTPLDLVGDIVGLIYALGGEPVFLVGHDAGAFPAWHLCLMRPDLVRGYVCIGIPFGNLRTERPEGHYLRRFAVPGRAEKDFARFDTATVLKKIYTLFSRSDYKMQIADSDKEIMDLVQASDEAPVWLTDEVLKVQTELYNKSGFESPLWSTYRDWQRKSELLSPWLNSKVITPCLYLTGKDDYALTFPFVEEYLTNGGMKANVPNLKDVVYLDGGHFVEEDNPREVNAHIIDFFREIDASVR